MIPELPQSPHRNRAKVKRACKVCGNEFFPWEAALRLGHGHFCNPKCALQHRRDNPKNGEKYFWSKVDKSPHPKGCWLWTGATYGGPYGYMGPKIAVHRYSWELKHNAPLPAGMLACHTCDTPLCCNPDHIFPGTYLDNSRDCVAKKRHRFGERQPMAKFTENRVKELRLRRAEGVPWATLAKEFGVSITGARFAATGHTWAHVQ